MAVQLRLFDEPSKQRKKATPPTATHWQPPKKPFCYLPTAYGVKNAAGEYLCIYVNRRQATQVFESDPQAYQLITELDPLYGLERMPGRVLAEK